MHICVIIPAAGSSSRFAEAAVAGGLDPGAIRSKLDEDLGGRPVLQRTVELFAQHPDVKTIIVAGPHDEAAFTDFKLRYGDKLGLLGVKLCQGGRTHRFETVAAALKLVPGDPLDGVAWLRDAAADIDAVVRCVAGLDAPGQIPAASAPLLEIWLEQHAQRERNKQQPDFGRHGKRRQQHIG